MDMRFGTWNVRSMYRAGSLRAVAEEISKYILCEPVKMTDVSGIISVPTIIGSNATSDPDTEDRDCP
jgi:hypothetical protein